MSRAKTVKKTNLTIDGRPVEADANETILDVSRRTGLGDIPTLCHSSLLPPYGSCFVCVVEVEGARTLQPACATVVREGMVVKTNTDKVRETRKMALELLLSAHWADCQGPCQLGCPAGVDAQGYLALAGEGRFVEAVELIKSVNPLPIVCGRICVRACEVVCERQKVEDPVGINFVKRYAAELEKGEIFRPKTKPSTGKKVAIVGGGPAGLTCAYYLAIEGVKPVIFEMWPQAGGMLRYGIPEYRLPKKLLDLEIETITRLGAEIRTNQTLGKDFSLDELKNQYDAIFVAVGAPKGKKMRVKGEDETEGVLSGLDFLMRVELGDPLTVHGRVIVIGGGNTAIDASRTAFRLGADEVVVLYRRTRKEMPADAVEIHAAEEEGVDIQFLAAPVAIVEENGRLKGLEALRMELGEPDASGRRRPVPIAGSEFSIECDFLFAAIGQDTDLWWTGNGDRVAKELERTKWNTFVTDDRTMATTVDGVFAGGDVVTGPTVVIDAIAAGKKAASGIVSYITTGVAKAPPLPFYSTKKRLGEPTEEYYSHVEKMPRSQMPEADPGGRKRSWNEAELGLDKNSVLYETQRCLVCGCLDLGDCDLQKLATEYGADPSRLKGEVSQYKADESHPFVVLDNNKCILCGKCVGICRDLVGVAALGFVSRGFCTSVKPTLDVPLIESPCIACGNCIDECPTGALMDNLRYRKLREWRVEYNDSVCSLCGVVCDLKYASVAPGLFWIETQRQVLEPSSGQLCRDGRFGHRYLVSPERLNHPMIRKNGFLVEATWEQALQRAIAVLKPEGGEGTAVIGSGMLTLEEAYLLQKIGRESLSTHHVAGASQLLGLVDEKALDELFGFTGSTVPLAAIDDAALIIAVNTKRDDGPVIDFRIHRAMQRGAKLLAIGPDADTASGGAALTLKTAFASRVLLSVIRRLVLDGAVDRGFLRDRCSGSDRLEYQLKNLSEKELLAGTGITPKAMGEAVDLIRAAPGNVVALAGTKGSGAEDLKALAILLLGIGKLGVPGSGLLLFRKQANEQGLPFAGLHPEFFAGRKRTEQGSLEVMKTALERGEVPSALVVGEDLLSTESGARLLAKVPGLVVLDTFLTKTAEAAEVVLPMSAPLETVGRFVNFERRIRRTRKLTEPPGGKETWEILVSLKTLLEGGDERISLADVAQAIDSKCGLEGVFSVDDTGSPSLLFLERFLTENGTVQLGKEGKTPKSEERPGTAEYATTLTNWVEQYMQGTLTAEE